VDRILPPDDTPAEGLGEFLSLPQGAAEKAAGLAVGKGLAAGAGKAMFGTFATRGAPLDALTKALEDFHKGAPAAELWARKQQTWVPAGDKVARFEVPDYGAALKDMPDPGQILKGKLEDFIAHPQGYAHWPQMRKIETTFEHSPTSYGQQNDPTNLFPHGRILVKSDKPEDALSIFMHEMGHSTEAEGAKVATGASPRLWQDMMELQPAKWNYILNEKVKELKAAGLNRQAFGFEQLRLHGNSADPAVRAAAADVAYKYTGGEAAARNIENRHLLTPGQLAAKDPEQTADVSSLLWLNHEIPQGIQP
jgi:hypothetical protein